MLAIVGIIIGSIGAVTAAAATVYTVRSSRRLNAAEVVKRTREADHQADENAAELRGQVVEEFNRRMELELKVAGLERRVKRLEEQVRSLGHEPVNGG
jgi:predicted ATP-grasp superfamily ATP-dependent carboligase